MKTSPVGLGFPQTPPFVPSVIYHIPRHIILGKQHQSMCTCVGMHIHVLYVHMYSCDMYIVRVCIYVNVYMHV